MTTELNSTNDISSSESLEDVTQVFQQLRELKAASRHTKGHSRVIILICACIDYGINTRSRIRGAMKQLGFDADHAVIVLNAGTDSKTGEKYWDRDAAGVYHNHSEAPGLPSAC